MGTILDGIVRTKRAEVQAAKQDRPLATLFREMPDAPPPRDFYAAVAAPASRPRLIAEIKKASPSAGLIREDFDPVGIARTYEQSGADALSVLTDATYFAGRLDFIAQVKRAVSLPVLRKDFIVDEYQVFESRAADADAILLIAEVLSPAQIESLSEMACRLGMASLVEVHTADSLRALLPILSAERRTLLGINNRDLHAQRTDLEMTVRLSAQLPPGTPFVSESGVRSREDVERLREAGASALLIGETFMRAPNIAAKMRELFAERPI